MTPDILTRLEKMNDTLTDIKVTLATNTQSLGEHLRRTELLEKHVDLLEAATKDMKNEVLKTKTLFMTLGWIFGAMMTLIPIALQVWKLVK